MRIFLIIAVAAVVLGQQQSLPSRFPGYPLGNPNAPVVVEEFGDFECSDCLAAWPTVKEVLAYYGPSRIYYIWHPFPLSAHRQAFDAAKAAAVVAFHNASAYFDFADYLFAHQSEFVNDAFFNKTEADLYDLFASYAANFGVNYTTFVAEMQGDAAFDAVAQNLGYAATRGVFETPTFFINGMLASMLQSTSTLEQWQAILDPLFEGEYYYYQLDVDTIIN